MLAFTGYALLIASRFMLSVQTEPATRIPVACLENNGDRSRIFSGEVFFRKALEFGCIGFLHPYIPTRSHGWAPKCLGKALEVASGPAGEELRFQPNVGRVTRAIDSDGFFRAFG